MRFSPEVQDRISQARELLTSAEKELEMALRKIEQAERAEKQMVSNVIRLAFEKVAAARQNLEAVLGTTP